MNRAKTRNIVLVAVGAVILVVSTLLTVPFAVPFTFQTFGVFFVLLMFGGRRGFLSIAVYISLGLVGIPVFSGFGAGFGVLFGPTGGYLFGFILIGCIYWIFEKHLKKDLYKIILLLCSMAIYYVFGTAFFLIWNSNDISISAALTVCVFPFILPDIAKLLLAYCAYRRIGKLS